MAPRSLSDTRQQRLIRWFEDLPSNPDMLDVVSDHTTTQEVETTFQDCEVPLDLLSEPVRDMHGAPGRFGLTNFRAGMSVVTDRDKKQVWSMGLNYEVAGNAYQVAVSPAEATLRTTSSFGDKLTSPLTHNQAGAFLASIAVAKLSDHEQAHVKANLDREDFNDPATFVSILRFIGMQHGRFNSKRTALFDFQDNDRALTVELTEVDRAQYSGRKIDYHLIRQNAAGQSIDISATQTGYVKQHEQPLYMCRAGHTSVSPDQLEVSHMLGMGSDVSDDIISSTEANPGRYTRVIGSLYSVLRPVLAALYPQGDDGEYEDDES